MRIARKAAGLVMALAAFATGALVAGCTSSSPTAPGTTTTATGTPSSLVSVTSTPPTFFLGMTGNIDVKLAGNPTKTSTIKVDFGDLSPAATMSAVSSAVFPHAYSKTGTFKVSATVTMPDGSVVSNAAEVSVLP